MADIELLPLPEWVKCDDLDGLTPEEVRAEMRHYARANLIPLQAKNERLREALAALKAENETLREALALLPDESDMIEHNPDEGPRTFCCWQEIKLRGLHDYLITHDEGCWYARMRALRDQENIKAAKAALAKGEGK